MRTFSPLLLLLIVISSCENEAFFDSAGESISVSKVESVMNLQGEAQRIAYNMLTQKEQHYLWDRKFKRVLYSGHLTSEQEQLVTELRQSLAMLLNRSLTTQETADFERNWVSKAQRVFSKAELYTLAYSITDQISKVSKVSLSQLRTSATTELESCQCNDESVWACMPSPDHICKQLENECLVHWGGCGFVWLATCNGLCWPTGV